MQQNSLPLLRIFAFGSTLDLVLNFFVFFTTLLLTFSPSLSTPFSDLLCNTLTRGEIFSATALMREREARGRGWAGLRAMDVLVWGVEGCEENWRSGVSIVLVAFTVGILVRIYGVTCVWEYYAALERDSLGEAGDWFDLRESEKETVYSRLRHSGRLGRSSGKSSPKRARFSTHQQQQQQLDLSLPTHQQSSASSPTLLISVLPISTHRIRRPSMPSSSSSSCSSASAPPSGSSSLALSTTSPIRSNHRSIHAHHPASPPSAGAPSHHLEHCITMTLPTSTALVAPPSPTRLARTSRTSETEDDYPLSKRSSSSVRRVRLRSNSCDVDTATEDLR